MLWMVPIAFVSGLLTAFSPCVLPILPVVLTSGVGGNKSRMWGVLVGVVGAFGLATLFLSAVVTALGLPADTIRFLAVVVLAFLGLSLLFPGLWLRIQVVMERFLPQLRQSDGQGFWSGVVTGVSLGIVWTPCVGPIVAAVATLAAVNSLSLSSVVLTFSYAIGAGAGLYVIARAGDSAASRFRLLGEKSESIRQVFGGVIVATAVMIFLGWDRQFQAWSLEALPESWANLAERFEERVGVGGQMSEMNKKIGNIQMNEKRGGGEVVREVRLQSDFSGAKVKKADLIQGCFGKDCIPSIDEPVFETARGASWLDDDDVVFAIDIDGVQRVYPQRILNWHEIVNDWVNEKPVAITFCPLCGSAVGFERRVDGVITEFGVSGKLHESDLVMYDRFEGNLWQQITGEAIVGPAARRGEFLTQIQIVTTKWGEWRQAYPETEVLSRETGHQRNYSAYPYGTYEENDEIFFGVKNLDKSLQIKTVVYGVEVEGRAKAYPEEVLIQKRLIEDEIGDVQIRVERKDSGDVEVVRVDNGERLMPLRLFWFAWAAFHPETELYRMNNE